MEYISFYDYLNVMNYFIGFQENEKTWGSKRPWYFHVYYLLLSVNNVSNFVWIVHISVSCFQVCGSKKFYLEKYFF